MSKVPPGVLRVVPLGGLGEVGMNCLALEQHDGICVVDCGVSFSADGRGIDVVHPDFRWLLERGHRVHGVFLTHGHEDHIGGLPFLLSELRVPVYGSPYALGLVRHRLEERGFELEGIELRQAKVGECHELGPFSVEPIRVSHSITEASALKVQTEIGTVVHSGDFNFDPAPLDGEPIDVERLRAVGDAGVELLLSDSTNIDTPERVGSEEEVRQELRSLVVSAAARVVVVLFASNLQRLTALGQIAQETGRKICLLGRSLRLHREVAREAGRLQWPSDLLIAPEQLATMPPHQILLLCSGTQGEPRAAMRRMASGEHPTVRLNDTDRVIFSSRIIPGNERAVSALHDDLLRIGVDLRTWRNQPRVHTSGHGGRSEQAQMLELLRPNAFIPVHGTLHHLREHAKLAGELGVERRAVADNGRSVLVSRDSLVLDKPVPFGKVPVTERGIVISEETLRERAQLGRSGVFLIAVGAQQPSVQLSGVGVAGLDVEATSELRDELERCLRGSPRNREAALRGTVRRVFRRLGLEFCRVEVLEV